MMGGTSQATAPRGHRRARTEWTPGFQIRGCCEHQQQLRRCAEVRRCRVPDTSMRIRILVTGGTFDKQYDELTGRLFFVRHTCPRCSRPRPLPGRRDGRDGHDGRQPRPRRTGPRHDRRSLPRVGGNGDGRHPWHRHHGRDRAGHRRGGLRDRKTIVLTGAMVPYAFGSSDGLFNLGSALSFAQVLPPGVYIAMNGQHFAWDRVRKNRESGIFEATRMIASTRSCRRLARRSSP